jgi:polar amino acid transport system substrate-binding protein
MVLRDVAALISSNCRNTDRVCRYGGDEMLIICPHTELSQASQLAERLRLALKGATFFSERGPIKVTGSFGVSTLASGGAKRDLVKRADDAHYRAKGLGGDHVCDWSADFPPRFVAEPARERQTGRRG